MDVAEMGKRTVLQAGQKKGHKEPNGGYSHTPDSFFRFIQSRSAAQQHLTGLSRE